MRYFLLLVIALCPWSALAQTSTTSPTDLPRRKTFTAHRSSSNNIMVASNEDSKHPVVGETLVLADLKGPGTVTHIWITVNHNEYAWPRLLRLRIYYDGAKTPSVDAPLGDFFAVGNGYERSLNSVMVRNTGYGRALNCYWRMPFQKSCKITVTNEGQRAVGDQFYYHVDWEKHTALSADDFYFHAYYRQGTPPPAGEPYTLLDVKGTGHYVGTVLSVLQSEVGWFGEGDDIFYVDGEKRPSIDGTGTEDYFNDAWGLHVSDGPWTGTPVAEGRGLGARLTGYRWHVPDTIPFSKSLKVQIEHAGWTYNPDGSARSGFEERSDFFSSVAFWYQKGVNEGLPEPPYGNGRLPHGNAIQLDVAKSLAEVTTEKGEVSTHGDGLLFQGEGEGSRLNLPFDVPRDGRYELIVETGQAPNLRGYVTMLDGKPTDADTSAPGRRPRMGGRVSQEQPCLGWFDLTKGRHTLTFACEGKDAASGGCNLRIAGVVLAEVGKFDAATMAAETQTSLPASAVPPGTPVYRGRPLAFYRAQLKRAAADTRATWLRNIGAFGVDATPAANEVATFLSDSLPDVRRAAALAISEIGPKASVTVLALRQSLKDEDPMVRAFSALALRAMGKTAEPAIPDLCAALKDPEDSVRRVAAQALGRMGNAAKDAVSALIEVLVNDKALQAQRNAAIALGQIGPVAESALPALREASKVIRLKWDAEGAIQRIEGKPVATWH